MDQAKKHYSYRIYADPSVARKFDADRFGGTIGQVIKAKQENAVFSVLPPVKDWKLIDVGAGTGRFTIPFLELGAEVTACDASEAMLQVLRDKTKSDRLKLVIADAHHLKFPDRSFHCAVSFRMLLHVVDWKKALSELCRVSQDWVVFDLPPHHGFVRMAPLLHQVKRLLFAGRVQSYRTFRMKEVQGELQKSGFEIVSADCGFFLPLVIHRLLHSKRFTDSSERFFSNMGLTRRFGSPFTLFARRSK